ncbi:MAG TPA: ABC transporter permease [Aldersonia sp.]
MTDTTAQRVDRSTDLATARMLEIWNRDGRHRLVRPTWFAQWRALSSRLVRVNIKNGAIGAAFASAVIYTLGFYLPLKFVMGTKGIDYAQFVMPVIVLQTMAFTMMSAGLYAADDATKGLTSRLQTMPIPPLVPLGARMTSGFVRSIVSLVSALCLGYIIGFRLQGGLGQSVLFCVFALSFATITSLGADALGSLVRNPQAVSQMLTLPTVILGMLSTGFMPESGFPSWIRPFVRNQPISQFSLSMQQMAGDGVSFHTLFPSLLWLTGFLVVFAPLAIWASGRRE